MSDPLLGTEITLNILGQDHTGRISAVYPNRLEVTIPVVRRAKGLEGTKVTAVYPDGQRLSSVVGADAHFSTLVVELPRPKNLPTPQPQAPEARQAASGARAEAPPEEDDGKRGADRRRFFRLAIELPVDVIEGHGSDREYVRAQGLTINLSGGGMLVDFERVLLAGVHWFRVHMPDGPVELPGRVLQPGTAMGSRVPVEFVNVHEMDRSKIIRFIFHKLRILKTGGEDEAPKKKDRDAKPRYKLRREKFFQPPPIRYW